MATHDPNNQIAGRVLKVAIGGNDTMTIQRISGSTVIIFNGPDYPG